MTEQQRKALHLWFRQVSEALNEKDFDFRDLTIEIPATEQLVKELVWKPLQKTMLNKTSTKDLDISEVSKVYDVLNRAFIDKLGIYVPFPDKEGLMEKRNEKSNS